MDQCGMTEITIGLNDPGMSPLHRAGLGGLALCLDWAKDAPEAAALRQAAEWEVGSRHVRIMWRPNAPSTIRVLLETCLRITEDGLIWFGPSGDPTASVEETILLHESLLGTFLQHNLVRPSINDRPIGTLGIDVDGTAVGAEFKTVSTFGHRRVASEPTEVIDLRVKSWLVPGASQRHIQYAETNLLETEMAALALRFSPVGASFFQVHLPEFGGRHRRYRRHHCVVIPDFDDIEEFVAWRKIYRPRASDLVVSGAGDAAARLLLQRLTAKHATIDRAGCTVIAFGSAAWNKQQKVIVDRFRIERTDRHRLRAFEVALNLLPSRRGVLKRKDGSVHRRYQCAPLLDLVAGNVLADEPWFRGFAGLWQEMRDDASGDEGRRWILRTEGGPLNELVANTLAEGSAERALVDACHEAWRRRMGEISEEARHRGSEGTVRDQFEREREKWRVSLVRCRNAAMLRQTLIDRFARAGSLPPLQTHWADMLSLIERRWSLARDLALLALASYRSGRDETDSQEDA